MIKVVDQNDDFISIKVGNYYVCFNNVRKNGDAVDFSVSKGIDSKIRTGFLETDEDEPLIFINYGETYNAS